MAHMSRTISLMQKLRYATFHDSCASCLQAVCALHSVHALHIVHALHAALALRASLPDSLMALPDACAVQACNSLAHQGKVMPDPVHLQYSSTFSACSLCQDCICNLLLYEDFLSHLSHAKPLHACIGDEDDDASVELSCRASALLHVRVFGHEPG